MKEHPSWSQLIRSSLLQNLYKRNAKSLSHRKTAWPSSQTSHIYNCAFWADLHLFPISRLARGSFALSCVLYHNVKHGLVIMHRLLGTPVFLTHLPLTLQAPPNKACYSTDWKCTHSHLGLFVCVCVCRLHRSYITVCSCGQIYAMHDAKAYSNFSSSS